MTPKNNETKINDVKKKIIISMCAIVLLVLTLFGITYAYFTSSIQGNQNDTSVDIGAAMLRLEYNGEDSYIEVTGLQPGETIESKKFSVKNTGTATIKNYDVILENLVNELSRYEDLTYELTCVSSDGKECNNNSGTFPRMNQVIVTNTIDAGVTHSYVLKLTYEDTNTNQSIDMNKEISAKVNIKDDYSDIKTFKIYGNTLLSEVQTRSLTPTNKIEYLGELVTDENDKNYEKYRVSIKSSGNNLIEFKYKDKSNDFFKVNDDGSIDVNVETKEDDYIMFNLIEHSVLPAGKYVFSCNNDDVILVFRFFDKTGTVRWYVLSNNETLSLSKDLRYEKMYLQIEPNLKVNQTLYFQLEKGESSTEYKQYKGKETIIYLDEPLRKIGDVADYIDLENKIVVRRVGEKIFDGTENFHTYENGVYYGLLHDYNIPAISNYYSNNTEDEIYFTSTNNSNAIHFRVNETADEFKTLLQERYNNNQPLKVLYALNELEFESIDVPNFEINNTNTITVCDNNSLCASYIEVEFDE